MQPCPGRGEEHSGLADSGGCSREDGRMDGWMDGWIDGQTDEQVNGPEWDRTQRMWS